MRSGTLALAIAALCLAGFTADVALGAVSQQSVIGDVGEMLVLFAACVAFVTGVLQKERAAGLRPTRD
jgi:hypothetical protein